MEELFHYSYDKISESTTDWQCSQKVNKKIQKEKWCITEKVHGANFVIITNGKKVNYAKRREMLSPNNDNSVDFYGFNKDERLMNRLINSEEKIMNIFNEIYEKDERKQSLLSVHFFCELFGGYYPHLNNQSEYEEKLSNNPIQTGIWYSPDIHFIIFDIGKHYNRDNDCNNDNNEQVEYLSYVEMNKILSKTDLLYCKSLFVGSLNQCLDYPIQFITTLPPILGYPSIPNNFAEGVVIKPFESVLYVENRKGNCIRAIVKRKIPQFKEERFFQSKKFVDRKEKKRTHLLNHNNNNNNDDNDVDNEDDEILANYRYQFSIDEQKDYVVQCIASKIHENRIQSALSKIGVIDIFDKTQLMLLLNEYVDDVTSEITQMCDEELTILKDNGESDFVESEIMRQCKNSILSFYKPVITKAKNKKKKQHMKNEI